MLLLIQRFVSSIILIGVIAGCLFLYGQSSSRTNNSRTNVYNSQAQVNAAQATAIIIDASGNYIVDAARATQIVADSDWGVVNVYQAGQTQGFGAGLGLAFIVAVVLLLGLLLAIAKRAS